MDAVTATSLVIALLGPLGLMIGYTYRGRGYGSGLIRGGVMAMLAVIVRHILRALHRQRGSSGNWRKKHGTH